LDFKRVLAKESDHWELAELFGSDSPLFAHLAGFAPRAGQAAMATAVADAIAAGENLVIEAGTGTGKTLAYLIPALLSGSRVILSTGTKTLQDQLFHRDLPVVTGALGRPAKMAQLKGRSNYLCLHRLYASRQDDVDSATAARLKAIEDWSLVTRSGDKVEVASIPEDASVWPRVTSTQDNCLGSRCEFIDRCHVMTARQKALAADIVVVNHHLLLADMVLKDEGFGELLPGFDAVIVDEAHQFPDIAQGFFNITVSSGGLFDLSADFRAEVLGLKSSPTVPLQLADALTKSLRDLRLTLPSKEMSIPWDDAGPGFHAAVASVIESLDDIIGWLEAVDEESVGLTRCRERACAAVDRIETINTADESNGLRWLGLSLRSVSLNYTPVEIAAGLQSLLTAQPCAWIFTSATLAVGSDFSHFLLRMGLESARTELIASPFDYAEAGVIYLPASLPDPSAANYTRAAIDALLPLIHASEGRAFLLFTSHRALAEAAEVLRGIPDFEYPLLVQGEAPRSKLLEQFARLEQPVLLGTASFWEGVDMRGDNLVLVAIDKLPFASPGDPMFKARLEAIRKAGGNPFRDYQVPQAVLTLKQGVGRLIRDKDDYGVVVLCDPRIRSRSYGKRFLESMPPFPVTTDLAAATAMLSAD
jgi:ATP-dependent DNA helicase DinG